MVDPLHISSWNVGKQPSFVVGAANRTVLAKDEDLPVLPIFIGDGAADVVFTPGRKSLS